MASASKGKGPFPNKAGEFCSNHHADSPLLLDVRSSPQEVARRQREYLARMRFGKPCRCSTGTSEEMAAMGFVGLYLKEDSKLFPWETPVDSDELQEDRVVEAGIPEIRMMLETGDRACDEQTKRAE